MRQEILSGHQVKFRCEATPMKASMSKKVPLRKKVDATTVLIQLGRDLPSPFLCAAISKASLMRLWSQIIFSSGALIWYEIPLLIERIMPFKTNLSKAWAIARAQYFLI